MSLQVKETGQNKKVGIQMKNIMTRAWQMYKSAGCTTKAEFAVALKMAWAEVRQTKIQNLVGSEKQVAWATDLRDKFLLGYNNVEILIADKLAKAEAKNEKALANTVKYAEIVRSAANRLLAMEKASDWIDHKYFSTNHEVVLYEKLFAYGKRLRKVS